MDCLDIVYIKGNPNSGTLLQHKQMDQSILEIINNYSYQIISSEETNKDFVKNIQKAKIYIGFSRGSRYLKKLNNDSLKISIGGISGSSIVNFSNKDDMVLSGDMSGSSMAAHFIIEQFDKYKIKSMIEDFFIIFPF